MKKKIFIDSDVLIDVLSQREPFFPLAVQVLEYVELGKVSGFTSPIIISNIHYILSKQGNRNKAKKAIAGILRILDIVNIPKNILEEAIQLKISDFEDSIQYCVAKANNIDFLITRNIKDYPKDDNMIITPENFIKIIGGSGDFR